MQNKSKMKIVVFSIITMSLLSFGGQGWTQATEKAIEAEKQIESKFLSNVEAEDLATKIHELDFPGYVGLKLKPESKEADLWLSEDPNSELLEVIRGSHGISVTVHRSPYSEAQLIRAVERINELVQSARIPGGVVLSSSSKREDGRGIDLTIDLTSKVPDQNWVKRLSEDLGIPVFVDPGMTNFELSSTRINDSSPWRGGSLFSTMNAEGKTGYCSQGFGVRSQITDIQYMLTARHCFGSQNQTLRTPQNSNTMGTWNPSPYYNSAPNDAALTFPNQGIVRNSVYYGNLTTSTAYQVTSVGSNSVGLSVCTNGANSGLHCNVVIRKGRHAAYIGGVLYQNVVTGSKINNQVTVAEGDSGGPVVSQIGSSGELKGFGIIHALTPIGYCADYSIQVNVSPVACGREVSWIDLNSALSVLNMDLK